MSTLFYDEDYWTERYANNNTPWDIGYASPPLTEFIESLKDKNVKILIPGCGNGHEAAQLYEAGYKNVFLIDISEEPIKAFKKRYPEFPAKNLIKGDYFELNDSYDVILEQTFFCALHPSERDRYAVQSRNLLNENGILAGVLFDDPLNTEHPPYGGNVAEYRRIFEPHFTIEIMEKCYNSIAPRAGRELFIKLVKE